MLDWGYDSTTSRVEIQSGMLALLRAVEELGDMYNRKAEADTASVLRMGRLKRFIRRVEGMHQ